MPHSDQALLFFLRTRIPRFVLFEARRAERFEAPLTAPRFSKPCALLLPIASLMVCLFAAARETRRCCYSPAERRAVGECGRWQLEPSCNPLPRQLHPRSARQLCVVGAR